MNKLFKLYLLLAMVATNLIAAHFSELNKDNKLKPIVDCINKLDEFNNFSMPLGATKSKSLRLFAERKSDNMPVFLKIYSDSEEMDVEGSIYNNHVNYLLDDHMTPNLVRGLDFFLCREENPEVREKLMSLMPTNGEKIAVFFDTLSADHKISVLVTQKIENSITLLDFYRAYQTKSYSSKYLARRNQILFQIFYTLKAFKDIGLYHGDLHLNNILLEAKPLNAIYEMGDRKYRVVSPITVRIFDFDKSIAAEDHTDVSPHLFALENQNKKPKYDSSLEEKFGFEFFDTFENTKDIRDVFYKTESSNDLLTIPLETFLHPSLKTLVDFFGQDFLTDTPDKADYRID
jgi:serine/threonine protein kinase